jgi:tetratricopeptide (TPR) repeat protein
VDRAYQAVVLENEFIYLVMLPELGGRIFIGQDKTNGYDFFYRHLVIKPALISTFGPWISGGVEFNWPQHHRPTTYNPTDFLVEENPDGSKTVWMGEHEALNRTKSMVGITLYPGKAFVETKVRLFNRTPFPQTFLWWANAGVPINEKYQVVFPPDVHHAVFHSKNPVTAFPIAKGPFAGGNDYGEGTDISYWVNSPGATSFFAAESKYEFFGGYDHLQGCGVVHVADAGISGGKKYFTWGNGPFGHQWQKNLYDPEEGGEYLELMAGVYTDNQPDFSWMMPYETRTFSQFWLPVQKIGAMKNANTRAAVNLETTEAQAFLGVYATEVFEQAVVTLSGSTGVLFDQQIDLAPGRPFIQSLSLPAGCQPTDLLLRVCTAAGEEIIRYQPESPWDGSLPEAYQPPAEPKEIATIEELFLIGLHLEQYRHPGIAPEIYWQEALRRDPLDSRTNLFMGKLHLSRGEFLQAEACFQKSIQRLTSRNFNPYDGEALYHLGLVLQLQGRLNEAYKAFYKATWNYAWQSAGFYGLAQIDLVRRDFRQALDHIERSLQANTQNAKARGLKAAILRHTDRPDAAEKVALESLALDPLDFWARNELSLSIPEKRAARLAEMNGLMRADPQTYLDIALDYAMAGLDGEANQLLEIAAGFETLHPMVAYALSFLASRSDRADLAEIWQMRATQAKPDYCFPWRLEELLILQQILQAFPQDARASYYLGNLLYDKKRYTEAIALWQTTTRQEPGFSIPWRNLGLAAYNVSKNLDQALEYYARAVACNPADPRLLFEQDNLLQRKAIPPQERLARFLSKPDVVAKRDDLMMGLMMLYNCTGQPEKALEIAFQHTFHPWEGGEGMVAGQFTNACWLLGRRKLEAGDANSALADFTTGGNLHPNLGEQPSTADIAQLQYYSALAYLQLEKPEQADSLLTQVLSYKDQSLSLAEYYQGLALLKLGRVEEGQAKLSNLLKQALEFAETGLQPNYFFYGNPNPTFVDDPKQAQRIQFTLLAGLAHLGLGDLASARSAFERVLAADPTNLSAGEEMRRLNEPPQVVFEK